MLHLGIGVSASSLFFWEFWRDILSGLSISNCRVWSEWASITPCDAGELLVQELEVVLEFAEVGRIATTHQVQDLLQIALDGLDVAQDLFLSGQAHHFRD